MKYIIQLKNEKTCIFQPVKKKGEREFTVFILMTVNYFSGQELPPSHVIVKPTAL